MAFPNGYAYRMTAPVANPTSAGDRALDAVAFPAAFLRAQGRIAESTYADYLVTTTSGTALRSSLNAAKDALYIDYPAMPQGRGEVYVYYGKAGASAPAAATFWTPARQEAGIVAAVLTDNGFEGRADGATLDAAIWTASGSPQNREYDTSWAKTGTGSMYLRGHATSGLTGTSGVLPLTLDANGSEVRFWARADTANQIRNFIFNGAGGIAAYFWMLSDGTIAVRTSRTGITGYTANVDMRCESYAAGDTQFRIVFDFDNDTYTLSTRTTDGAAWTQRKPSGAVDFNIPFFSTTNVSTVASTLLRVNPATNLWIDDLACAEPTAPASAFPANCETASESETGGRYYLFGADVTSTYIESGLDAYRGAESVLKVGTEAAPAEQVIAEIPQSVIDAVGEGQTLILVNLYGRRTNATTYYRAEILFTGDNGLFSVRVRLNSTNATVGVDNDNIDDAPHLLWRFTASGSNLSVQSSINSGATWTTRWTATDTNIAGPGDWFTDPAGYEVTPSPAVNHTLIKFFEGALPKGTITAARVKFDVSAITVPANTSITAHRLKTATLGTTYGVQHIATGWGGQNGAPTWTKRLLNRQPDPPNSTPVLWQTAGATHANEIEVAGATLALATTDTPGSRTLTLPATWFSDWINTDAHANGFLLKPSADCLVTINKASVVFEVEYSSFDADQYDKRKVTTDTSFVTHPYAGERLIQLPTQYAFGSHLCMDPDMRLHLHTFDGSGRIHRSIKSFNVAPPGFPESTFYWKNWPAGLHYDPSDGRYWIMCGTFPDGTPGTVIGYSEPHTPTGWTWSKPTAYAYASKSGFAVRNGVAHIAIHYGGAGTGVEYLTYTRATNTWSSPTAVVTSSLAGLTERALASGIAGTDVMAGAGVITLDGATDSYPVPGVTLIDSEIFWYTGKSGNTLTGVTRAWFGTTAAAHSIGATANLLDNEIGAYTNVAYDATNDRIHVTFTCDTTHWGTGAAYTGIFHVYHNLADAAGVWKDAAGNVLTLPLNISNLPRISGNDFGAWNHNLITLSDGTTIASYGEQHTKASRSGLGQTKAKYRRLNNAGLLDIVDMGIVSPAVNMSDLGNGKVVFAGVGQVDAATNPDRIFVAESNNSGASLASVTTLDPHTFAGGYIWEPTMTERADTDGNGMLAYHHLNYHGAVYFQQVEYIEYTYRPRRQRMALGGI